LVISSTIGAVTFIHAFERFASYMKMATTLCRWSKLISTHWSHGVKNWQSAVCCQKRRASIICCRTRVMSPSPADCIMQERLNH